MYIYQKEGFLKNVLLGDEEAQDSPRSCETPPPLNPPRSWEIIQAGMIDQTQVRRRSLMALGTLESHRESFIENGNSNENHDVSFLPNINNGEEPGKAGSDMEWDSDDSLPLDRSLPPPPEFPDSSLDSNLPLPEFIITPDSSLPFVPELIITPDRRSRITLERTPSLDLTDSDNVDCNKVSADGTLGKDGTIKGSEEQWESNDVWVRINDKKNKKEEDANLTCDMDHPTALLIEDNANYLTNTNIVTEPLECNTCDENKKEMKRRVRESCSLDNLDEYSGSKHNEIESSQSYEKLDSERFGSEFTLDTNEIELTQSLDSLEEESMIGTVVKRNSFLESHSLELLDEVKKPIRHVRNKSMSVSSCHWSKSVDVLSKPTKSESLSLDRQRIDAQLQCYDEALRELAEEQQNKEDLRNKGLERKPLTKCNLDEVVSCEIVEPRVVITQKPCTSTSQGESWSFTSLQGSSLDNSNYSNTSSETFRHDNTRNSIDHLEPKCDYLENINKININITPKLLENNTLTTEVKLVDQQQIGLTKYEIPPLYSVKQAVKERNYSENSKSKHNRLQRKQKMFSSLELPSRTKHKDTRRGSNVSGVTDWKRSLTVSSMPDHQNDTKLPLGTISSNPPEKSNQIEENQKTKQCVKKFLKKEKSESDIKRKGTDKSIKKVGRSASLHADQVHGERSYKMVIPEGTEAFINEKFEKSESDSDWGERPLQSKRKQFLAMRGVAADSDDSNDEDLPFWQSSGKGGFFTRQDTVIYNHHTSSKSQTDYDGEKSGGEGNDHGSSSSDSGSISLPHSDASLSPSYTFHSNSILKEHLKQTVEEKAHLEESVGKLKEQTERLQYNLADANHSIAARDEKLVILQEEVTRLSTKYSATLEEYNTLKQQFMAAEMELKHLRELNRINREKEHKKSDLNSQQLLKQLHEATKAKKRIEFEKEMLISQHVMDLKKLQQDTIHWKNLYEDAISKIEQIEGLCDPNLIDNNQHIDNVKSAFKKFREGKVSELYKIKDGANSTSIESKGDSLAINQLQDSNDVHKEICMDATTIDNQVATLQLQLQQEKSRSSSLESQVKKMLLDLQNKIDLEAELENLNRRLEKEFVPRVELENLRASQEIAFGRIRQQAIIESDSKLNTKLAEINDILKLQLQEQIQIQRQKESMEAQMKQEFENTRQKLLLELSRVQAALKAKELEEISLRNKCDALEREAEKAQQLKQRQLIEKSYNVDLVGPNTTKENALSVKPSMAPPPPPPPPFAPTPLELNLLSADSLRQQLEQTMSKHRDIQLSVVPKDRLPSPPGRPQH